MKHALRQLAKNPGFTVFALVTLALGIGVNTTAFTTLNRLLLQSLPYRGADRLVKIWASTPRDSEMAQTPGDFVDEREHNGVFEAMAAYYPGWSASLAEAGQAPIRCLSTRVTANFFSMKGAQPQMGRLFTEEEEKNNEPVVLVSNSFWHEHYGADPRILGRVARIDARDYTIIGVMPRSLDDPTLFGGRPGFWPVEPIAVNRGMRNLGWYSVAARLKPGVTLQQAQAAMSVLAARMAHDYPQTNTDRGLRVVAFSQNSIGDTGAQLTWLVLALSGVVLLIACVNLANLQLVRTTRRAREIGIRLALGSSRTRLIGMLLSESFLLSAAGGALALLVAVWSNAYVGRYFEVDMPLDLRVLGFTFAASIVTGAVFGTVPAWIASRADVTSSLKTGGRGATSDRSRKWMRQGLVVVELGLALVLLAGAGFFVSGIYRITHRDLRWNPDNELVGFIELDGPHFGDTHDPRSLAFGTRLREVIGALPGVQSVALGLDSPAWGYRDKPFRIEGRPAPEPGKEAYAGSTDVTGGYLGLYGIRIVQGRDFRDTDRLGAPSVVIVNESMAKTCWPGENPIGKRIGRTGTASPDWAEVVGVMSDFEGAADYFNPATSSMKFLRSWDQNNDRFVAFNIRTVGDPAAMKQSIRRAIGLLSPDLALSQLSTVKEVLADEVSYFAFIRRLLIQISVLGLLLAAVGIYGVVANLAAERTKEIGIRMALGAQPAGILWLFLKNGIVLSLVGVSLGLAASFVLLNLLGKMLPMVHGSDPRVVAAVSLVLVVIALLACWLPARRTTRINPTVALRAE